MSALDPRGLNNLRREILRMAHPDRQRWLLAWLGSPRFCDPSVYDGLVRTPAMQTKISELGLGTRLQLMRAARRHHGSVG